MSKFESNTLQMKENTYENFWERISAGCERKSEGGQELWSKGK